MGDWDGAYRNLADVFNKMMADHSLARPEPLVALGVMENWKHNPKNAAAYFIEALKYAPQDVLALGEYQKFFLSSAARSELWAPR